MIGVLFVLFNLSLYYTLSGFYLYMLFETPPLIWGLPILLAVSAIYMFFKIKVFPKIHMENTIRKLSPIVISICLPPLIFILFNPTVIQLIHFLPAWVLTVAIFKSRRANIGYEAFKAHFSFTAKFFLVLVFAIFGYELIARSFISVIIYLVIYLLSGMTLLRILRQDGKLSASRNIIVMLALLLIGIIFAGLNMQHIILSGLGFAYQGALWIIVGLGIAMFSVVGFIIELFTLFRHSIDDIRNADDLISDGVAGSGDELVRFTDYVVDYIPAWSTEIGIAILLICSIIIGTILTRLFMKKGTRSKRASDDGIITEEEYGLTKSQYKEKNRRKIFRPNDPRHAIRWHYRKFLKEGITRGAQKPLISDTSEKINKKYSSFFSKNEANELRELYIEARYQENSNITKEMSDNAAKLWRKLKAAR